MMALVIIGDGNVAGIFC